jgi:tetratricopeptide (TPR) repeat protein
MLSWHRITSLLALFFLLSFPAFSQNTDQLQVGPPPMRRAEPPAPGASAEELEKRGDELRAEKNYLDAIDYYNAVTKKGSGSSSIFNKIGICHLQMQRYDEAKKSLNRAIKADRNNAIAYNNLGIVFYEERSYGKAIRLYEKAITIDPNAASYYSNLAAAYFSKKAFDKATLNYSKALELDPDIFERLSRAGVQAQIPSPQDRARYDYVLAKLYARMGVPERSLRYLRKAMEDGYKDIGNVYKDAEFTELRKDPRFAQLMAAKPQAITE